MVRVDGSAEHRVDVAAADITQPLVAQGGAQDVLDMGPVRGQGPLRSTLLGQLREPEVEPLAQGHALVVGVGPGTDGREVLGQRVLSVVADPEAPLLTWRRRPVRVFFSPSARKYQLP